MAFDAKGLNLVAGSKAGNAPQVWTYSTEDTPGTVDGSGYFNTVASLLKVGDLIYVASKATSSTDRLFGFHVVLSNTGSVVDVSNANAIGATNSD